MFDDTIARKSGRTRSPGARPSVATGSKRTEWRRWARPGDVDREVDLAVPRQVVEERGETCRDPGPDEDEVDARQQGAVGRGRRRELDLLEEVDARPASPCAACFARWTSAKAATTASRSRSSDGSQREPWREAVRLVGRAPAPDEVAVQHLVGDLRSRELGKRLAQLSVAIPVLQAPAEHRIERDAGDDAEAAGAADRPGETPVRDADAHTPLDDPRVGHRGVPSATAICAVTAPIPEGGREPGGRAITTGDPWRSARDLGVPTGPSAGVDPGS